MIQGPPLKVLTSLDELFKVPEAEAHDIHLFRGEVLVYFYDPLWKVMWGRSGTKDNYLSVAAPVRLKEGQRVLIEGGLVPVKGTVIENPTVRVLPGTVAVEPLVTDGHVGEFERFDRRVVTLEGVVDRQLQTDPDHVELSLVSEDLLVSVRLLAHGDVPAWEGTRIRVRGVYSATADPAGGRPKLEVWVQDTDAIRVQGRLDEDDRFTVPVTPIAQVGAAGRDRRIRVTGMVWSQQPGHSLTLRDDTGLLIVRSVQSARVGVGEMVEASGYPTQDGGDIVLTRGVYRRARATAPGAKPSAALSLAQQVRDLSPAEAEKHHPVRLAGVVTWANPEAEFFYIRDISGGICVAQPPGQKAAVIVGLKAEVTGVSVVGEFVPMVAATRVHYTATVDLPEARPVTLEQALTGVEEAQWVRMTGYIRAVGREGPWARLDLTTSAGEFTALLPPEAGLDRLAGSVVTARGVCSAVANRKRQLTAVRLWVPSREYVEVDEAVPSDPFAVPLRAVATLRQFGSLQLSNRRVHVAGVVLSHSPGRSFHLQDDTEGVLVLSRDAPTLQPGDHVDVVGFPGRENSRVVLREAVVRRTGTAAEPRPVPVARLLPADPELDGRLVRLSARLLTVNDREKGSRLMLQAGTATFEGLLDVPPSGLPRTWLAGSEVELTGVYLLDFDEYKRPHNVQLQLRSPADVRIVRRASWWTVPHVLALAALLAVGAVLGLGWGVALRRRVRRQTEVIREQLEKEKAARLDAALARASKLESLGVLAGGIAHDFNNLLTVVMCNLSLARLDRQLSGDTQRCLQESEQATARASDLTRQLLTFAKGGAPVRRPQRLPAIVQEAAGFALHGAKARFELEASPDLWPVDVDKGQIGQVVQNLVMNANHAMPQGGTISIRLGNADVAAGAVPPLPAGRYVRMIVVDPGSGIPAEKLQRIFDPYFTTNPRDSGLGLATVYSIVKQHQGHVEVQSTMGVGTTFSLWLPAAAEVPEAEPVAAVRMPRRTGRVLFMDDEPSIRLLAGTVLKRMGLVATLVEDGRAVVREYEAARRSGEAFDLVILDLTVPGGMGGLEALNHLRAIDPNVRAIVSSGYSSDPVMANFRAHGFATVVAKPYEAGELARAIDSVLGRDASVPGNATA